MWRAVLIDDENVILNGLKILIDWESYDIKIVGEAGDGEEGLKLIKEKRPDIVLVDIMMPKISGLDIIKYFDGKTYKPKFILISGHQEFSFAQDAIKYGAVDYLLKPVSAKDLSASVEKSISMLKDQTTIEVFKEEDKMQLFFKNISEGDEYAEAELYEQFLEADIDLNGKFYVGLCFGIIGGDEKSDEDYGKFELQRFVIYNKIQESFKNNGKGFLVKKEKESCNIIGTFLHEEREYFYEKYITNIKVGIEEEYGIKLCIGIGIPTEKITQLKKTFREAKHAYGLYFFEEKTVIDYRYIEEKKAVSNEEFNMLYENAFHAILFRDGKVLMNIEKVMDAIGIMHYGNRFAAINRCLIFTGDLLQKLFSYHLLTGNFNERQDKVQEGIRYKKTYRELKTYLLNYYEALMPEIYFNARNKDSKEIERAKDYIKKNYMNNISLKDLADVACVSQNYFSALFKRETGENYKTYATKIRMDEAMKMVVNTDMKTYEISEAVGYNNVRRFVDTFKGVYMMSPLEYRRMYKNK